MLESSISSAFDRIHHLQDAVKEVEDSLVEFKIQRDIHQRTYQGLKEEVSCLNNRLNNLKLLEAYLAQFADERQAQVYRQLESTVTEGLQTIFEEDIALRVSNKMVGARSETLFTLVSPTPEGELETAIMGSRGGGVAAVAGLLIQAVLVLLTPGLRPIIFLDESTRNISEDYLPNTGEFLRDLCERTGLQIVLVSHQPTLSEYADAAYSFSYRNGKTVIKKDL